jgi:hypothetical protein
MNESAHPHPLCPSLVAALALVGVACSTAAGGGSNGSGPPSHGTGGDDGSYWDEPDPGLDEESGVDLPEEYDCVTHRWRGYAYPIYANEDGLEVVSPGLEPHAGVCVGTEDVSEDEHWAAVSVCGPGLGTYDYNFPDEPLVAAMLDAAQVKCEEQLLSDFESRWPELDQQYEHWLGPEEGTDIFTLSRVACVPLQAENPYADYAAGSCAGYDDPTLAQLEPFYDEEWERFVSCDQDVIGECTPPHVIMGAQADQCAVYREHVADDITRSGQGRSLSATLDTHMVNALLSLQFSDCEYDRYDGRQFTVVDDWSIFAAVGFQDGDRPVSAQAVADGQPTGPVYPLGTTPGQELDALAGLVGVNGEWPTGLRVTFIRAGATMTLDLVVIDRV